MQSYIFGQTSLGLPIIAHKFGTQSKRQVLILGGVHGDEIEGIIASNGLLNTFNKSFHYDLQISLVPIFNVEGALTQQRCNFNQVDLNRNLNTQDWSPEIKGPRYHPGPHAGSEPENQSLMEFIKNVNPCFILSLHSWHPVLNINGDCENEAKILAQHTGYKIDKDIGYPTPGCLGTYAGLERTSPTLTYEIERGLDYASILNIHVPAILECLKETEKRDLR